MAGQTSARFRPTDKHGGRSVVAALLPLIPPAIRTACFPRAVSAQSACAAWASDQRRNAEPRGSNPAIDVQTSGMLMGGEETMSLTKYLMAAFLTTTMLASPALAQDEAKTVIIHAGTLLANPGEAPLTERSIILNGNRIEAIEAGFVQRDGAEIVDLRNAFVMPGMIDSHVHITSQLAPDARLKTVENSDADWAIQGAKHGKRTLEAGFTTVQDLGARGQDAVFALRDASKKNDLPLPRIRAAGYSLSVSGGHGDGRQGYNDDVAEVLHKDSICNGADDCRRAAREQIRKGADIIKITATGGVLSNTLAGFNQQFTNPEIEAIVDAANSMGRKVTAHAHGLDGINSSLTSGVMSIEHGTYLDDSSIALFKEKGAYLVPTVMAGDYVAKTAKDAAWMTEAQRIKSLEAGPLMLDMLRKAHAGGVKIAFGTDSGVSIHGDNATELVLMVEAGMTPQQALTAATVNAAEHIGMADQVGTLEVGKLADIIAVDGNPLENIERMRNVGFVMKDGIVYKSAL
ncbi:amidohydrolase family protein [uncultured Paracoccus sp.]|nr:amidohydrolase family protein [uncultured Paracoccus sp.]